MTLNPVVVTIDVSRIFSEMIWVSCHARLSYAISLW